MSRAAAPRSRTSLAPSVAFTILALILSVGAYVIAGFGKRGQLPATFALYVTIFAAGYAGTLVVTRVFAPRADPALFPTAAVLVGLGFAMIFRLSGGLAAEQATWIVVGLVAYALTLIVVRDARMLDAYTYTIGLLGLLLLLLPVAPGIGRTINGARLWVQIGPIGFQPAEIGKVLVVIFLASYLTQKRELLQVATARIGPFRLPPAKHLGPVLVAWGASLAILFLQKDLGASLLYFGIFVVMLWVATGRTAYLVIGLILFVVGAYAGWLLFDHVQLRVDIWLHALDPAKVFAQGYGQVAQAEFGMASGGIVGTGLGQGSPGLIPFASTDFIFAAIGEELGLLGTTAVLLLILVLVGKGLRVALRAPDGFSTLLAVGLSTLVALQAFVIIGGVTRIIPLTGVTLPFVSYGGSSLVSNFV
ncbi:MAG TPA: FtsW/RodA/SpoVE family cell cycle protein, partial [Actinomycetota bacterium]|nr:FtsW/RodA/SpoVE family cell cycle protein [Actinomycetota bacterium]